MIVAVDQAGVSSESIWITFAGEGGIEASWIGNRGRQAIIMLDERTGVGLRWQLDEQNVAPV